MLTGRGKGIPDEALLLWIAAADGRLLCECKLVGGGEVAKLSDRCQVIAPQERVSSLTVSGSDHPGPGS